MAETNTADQIALENLRQVEARVTLKRSEIYRRMKEGRFPKPIVLGPRRVAWVSTDITHWIGQRIAESRQTGA